jgi:hypothetical protein
MTRRLTSSSGSFSAIFLCLLFALLALGREKMLRDPGTFWHTQVGREMLSAQAVMRTDHYTFTNGGQPWIAQQWLAELVMAAVHGLAGLDGLLLIAAAILAATYAFAGDRLRAAGLGWPATIILLLLVIASSSFHFLVRPHLVTIALMAYVFAILCDVESGRSPLRRLMLLPALMILWTNLHGGALGGLATILLVLLLWLCRSTRYSATEHAHAVRSRCLQLAVPAALCTIAILINPYGPSLPSVWLSLMRSPLLPQVIQEHAPLRLISIECAMILALASVYMITLFRAWPHGRRTTWLIPLVWLALAFSRVRHGPIFAVCAVITIADMLAAMPRAAITVQQVLDTSRRSWLVPTCCTLMILLLQSTGVPIPLVGAHWARLDPTYWPIETTRDLQRIAAKGSSPHVFNDMRFGGYLIAHAPNTRPFIDDRCELHREQGIRRYLEIRHNPPLIEGLFAELRLDMALVAGGTALDRYLAGSAHWMCISRDPASRLYARRRTLAAM